MQVKRWVIAAAAAAAIALGLMPGVASAQVRVDPQPLPYYARIPTGTGEWTPVIFYRPADCIPENFNLLNFFDPPRAFGCGPMTVDGFAIWETGPGLDPAPMQANLRGLGAVPIWFVRTEDYLTAREIKSSGDAVGVHGESAHAEQLSRIVKQLRRLTGRDGA